MSCAVTPMIRLDFLARPSDNRRLLRVVFVIVACFWIGLDSYNTVQLTQHGMAVLAGVPHLGVAQRWIVVDERREHAPQQQHAFLLFEERVVGEGARDVLLDLLLSLRTARAVVIGLNGVEKTLQEVLASREM